MPRRGAVCAGCCCAARVNLYVVVSCPGRPSNSRGITVGLFVCGQLVQLSGLCCTHLTPTPLLLPPLLCVCCVCLQMSDHVMHYLAHSAGFLQHTPSSTHADADAAAGAGADAEQEAWAGLLQGDTAKASGSCTVVAVLDQQQQQQQASSSSSFTSAAAAASAVDSPAPDCSPNHHHRGSSCPSSNHADAQECTSRCPTTTGTQHAAANNRSTGAISSHQQTCNAPVASPAAAPIAQQSAELHDDKQLALLQQQGCNIVLVTRDAQPPRLAQDANLLRPAAGAAADTAAGSVRHLQGVRGRRGADGDGTAGVLMLPAALLQRLQDSSNTTRCVCFRWVGGC